MKNSLKYPILSILIHLTVAYVQGLPLNHEKSYVRHTRDGFLGLEKLFRKTTMAPTTTTTKILLPNNLELGECNEDDKLIYIDDTRLESNNSTLSGVLEVYLDSPYTITCIKLLDQLPAGTGAIPTYNSGGKGHKFVKIDVDGKYGYGIHFKIFVWGKLDKKNDDESENVIQ